MPNATQNPNTLLLAKDRHIAHRLERELRGNFPADIKAKKQAQLDSIIERSSQAVQARMDSVPSDLKDKLNADLPVTARADEIIRAIQNNQVIIVAGETGSGKTTQLPKLVMLAGRGITGQIGHTQPRRLAARSVAMRIADELGESLGQTVSFKVRFTEQGSRDSLIKLMTDGILLAELGSDKFLTRYDTIIIDEAHERSLNIDFILGYLKRLLPKRPDLKVIITSATLDTARFAEYFKASVKGDVPIINVEGRSYPVETRYRPLIDEIVKSHDDDAFDDMEDKLPRALTSAVAECFDDARTEGHPSSSDILIFASTEAEIREIQDILTAHAPPHTEILPLFARQSFAEQQCIFKPTGGRRIIISTNVAETALTVPNIRYVIDLGFARISRYNYRSRIQRLPIEAISQAAANQRAGRCGRIGDGVCIRLYSKEDFDSRPPFTEPEILRTNLASVILQMEHLGLGDVAEFDFITPPDLRLVNDGRKLLHELGALSDTPTKTAFKKVLKGKTSKQKHSALTDIGKKMARMPIDPCLARMLIAGHEFACLDKMLIIVSALAVQDVRERPADKQSQADQKHALFRRENSDFLFYVELFNVLFSAHEMHGGDKLTGNGRKNFAKKHYLSFPRIKEWQKTHEQLSQMVADLGYQIADNDNKIDDNNTKKADDKKDAPKGRIGLKGGKKAKVGNSAILASLKEQGKTKLQFSEDYTSIHRALLTALLSFVAHKTDTVGEYLMTKNQKARIFPASTLHKKGAEWVLAFEVVETSQVYMRTLSKIEPEWILSAGKNLLKYHYFEPHWSKKAGRVQAYAQISLFGLIIVHKQLVNYETIDLTASREIFIRDALVGDVQDSQADERYPKALPFLTHNRQKIKDVGDTEDKLRRRDLLVDEERLYEFYDDKIPPYIASAKAFEDWLGKVGDDEFLKFKDEDVVNSVVNVGQEFPKFWQVGAVKFPLSYVFDPSSDDDGVSVKVGAGALSQLDGVDLLWGVAGWRFELVSGLLKTLPKDIRRKIVPIPDTAHALMDKLTQGNGVGLLDQLCHNLLRMGVKVGADDFKIHEIDKYLQPLICVLDDKGRVIEKGRDLEKLQAKYRTHAQVQTVSEGIHDSFPEHFDFIKTRHHKGMVTQAFFALSPDETGKVAVMEFGDLTGALAMHKKGVLSLVRLTLGAKQKQLTSQIDKVFKMAFAPLGDLEKLKSVLVDATLQATFEKYAKPFVDTSVRKKVAGFVRDDKMGDLLDKVPLNAGEFGAVRELISGQFLSVGQEMLKVLKDIYTTWQTVRGQLLMLDRDIFGESIDDIEDQLDDLCLGDFVYRVPYEAWRQYPRYLGALKVRLDRLPNNLDNDLDGVYALDEHMERLANRIHDPKISEYRWLVEEYRIQLFSQPMKTAVPVSAKRLDKVWASVMTR
ncbi:ATP-dependent RNA helicase HrpA [Moraxella bovis]|uniref:ATP-dependent RNA helicase HrpA n=2 Tax=Moraxella bovis TaxID=476 RepID=A0AAQ2T0R7_MORBO|nr:ATP-dependent RNA helicase HrpA [Moraxella bovis]AWY21677.1 ATP-dependent RNA helicase HrpA [Moraxella bovis]UYZ74706.1 ATP-dependent RNA helicase HrpA [Moraxella bovis]UYZ80037.1 ATP-dependent RNA helicase HrpA [Moraxella bovis]UYZ87852.1 ATP-dependent RNA helicase HrpA [Moraxella bovis]UYZ93255.1 ATP-dependent RNA helicase HrpA [Moraxella bovis]